MTSQWGAATTAIERAYAAVRDRGQRVEPSRWQSMDVSKRLEATTFEVLNHTVQFPVPSEDLDELRETVQPNLPWADDHFLERVGGKPLNPGVEWARWPWGNSANSFRSEDVPSHDMNPSADSRDGWVKGFSHTYAERMWPVHAHHTRSITSPGNWVDRARGGIRYRYGDAGDVVDHLTRHPDSRQAFLPIWFPEDTGKTDVRVPCTLGYHFIQRRGYLHCAYYIRSCDLYRHFRDDVYLTVRLQLWMLDQLRQRQATRDGQGLSPIQPTDFDWVGVRPGLFTMHVVSLHAFVNDCTKMWPGWRPRG